MVPLLKLMESLLLTGGAMLLLNHFQTNRIYVLVLIFLMSCSSQKENIRSKQAGLYFGAGTQSLMDKQYTEALKNLLQANKLDPNNSEILNNLGMAYYFKGERDLALNTLNEALKLDENNSNAKVNLASIYFKEGRADEAEKIYKQVLRDLTYDKQARTLYNLGLIQLEIRKDVSTAEDYFKKSIKEDENYCPSLYHLGLIQFNRRQFNSSLKSFKEAAMGVCYESPAPHYYQALTLIELRKYDDARIKLNEIDTRFKGTTFAAKARSKAIELNDIENKRSSESHASQMVLDSPNF